ncbi:hypothetical protein Tco_1165246 [Tanacetum coccineum]
MFSLEKVMVVWVEVAKMVVVVGKAFFNVGEHVLEFISQTKDEGSAVNANKNESPCASNVEEVGDFNFETMEGEEVSLVYGVFKGAFGTLGEETWYCGEGVVVSSCGVGGLGIGEVILSTFELLQMLGFFLQIGFTLILDTLDGLDEGLLGDVIGEDECDKNKCGCIYSEGKV